ncbi:MAG: single-stranded DNA-binding protein [Actinobacteria bacterium]|nr:single-stranded DNA-binding protein [Actinomycetota bacterium]
MANLNKVLLIGNLTRDPQLTYLPSQTPVTEFGLAINRRWTSQDGTKRDETCFVDCRCYGRQAETLNKYVRKGNPLFVEGRLQLDTWTSQEGQRRSKHRVIVETFQFLGAPNRPAQGAPADAVPAGSAESEQRESLQDVPPGSAPDDDIPF